MNMEFKDRLKFLRRNFIQNGKRLTQEQLGNVLGYKYTSISNYESGRNEPCIRDLIKLANFFDVSMDYLLCAKEQDGTEGNTNLLFELCSSFSDEDRERIIVVLEQIKEIKESKK